MNSSPRRLAAIFVLAALAAAPTFLRAGDTVIESRADKNVAEQQKQKAPFPFHLQLDAGIDSYFVFRGINIIPEQRVNVAKAALPIFQQTFAGQLSRQDIKDIVFAGFPRDVKIARESGIGYFDAALTFSPGPKFGSLTAGAFYAIQTQKRIAPDYFGDQPFFRTYEELDYFATYSRALGPVNVSLGGTYYHVRKSATFDTLELNAGLSYTAPKFPYLTASFAYNYAGSLNYDPEYLDGHYLESRLTGNLPFFKNRASFNPYVLISAGQGIVPRAFNTLDFATFFTQPKFAALIQPILQNAIGTGVSGDALRNAAQAFDPATLDREFDFNNFQTGFRLSFDLTRNLTFIGHADYSRPLGNLRGEPYEQKDIIWGGVLLSLRF